jgi:hypothetical protein
MYVLPVSLTPIELALQVSATPAKLATFFGLLLGSINDTGKA